MSSRAGSKHGYLMGYGNALGLFAVRRAEPGVKHRFYKGSPSLQDAFDKDWKVIAGDLTKASRKALAGHEATKR